MGAIKHATTLKGGGVGQWTFLFLPSSLLGTRSRVRLKGTLNGEPFEATANAWQDDQHVITVNAQMRARYGVKAGSRVKVELEPAKAPKPPAPPRDLAKALAAAAGAKEAWKGMAPSHRKEYVRWISEAKAEATRARRVAQTVEKVLVGYDPFRRRPKAVR